jgi:hypothetical protein
VIFSYLLNMWGTLMSPLLLSMSKIPEVTMILGTSINIENLASLFCKQYCKQQLCKK